MSNSNIDFSEFEKPDFNTWKEKVIADLKGKDYSILVSQTDEEIEIQAIIESKSGNLENPNSKPFTRGNKETNNDWIIFQSFDGEDSKDLNDNILLALNKGVAGVELNLEDYSDLKTVLKDVKLEHICSTYTVSNSKQACEVLDATPENVHGWLNFNPMTRDHMVGIDEVMNNTKNRENFKAFNIDGAEIRNLGGNITDEIAFLLSCGNEYLNHFQYTGIDLNLFTKNIHFTTGIGPNYFFEIAKIRAIRKLWANIIAQYKPSDDTAYNLDIHAKTLSLNLHAEDPYINLLRQTTEAMSACIGGCNSLEVVPYIGKDKEENELFKRMSKNIQLILKEESMMNQVIDPAGGSYYIEALTEEICKKSWAKFQEMEAKGGYLDAYDDFVKNMKESKANYESKVASGEKIQVGVNKYTIEKV